MNLLRSNDLRVREQAAIALMNRQRVSLRTLTALLELAQDTYLRKILKARIHASTRHINGWQEYISSGCPLERRAQVRLNTYPVASAEMFA